MGMIEEAYRLPLTPMSGDHRFAIRRALEELHLLEPHQ
jgi:hypothetical protein